MNTTIYDQQALEYFFRGRHGDLKRFRRLYFREAASLEEMNLPAADQAGLQSFSFDSLSLVSRTDSTLDGASKLLLETEDGLRIETVILRIGTGRVTLCLSSQAGCTEKCRFCSTGAMGFKRNLTLAEITDQVITAQRILKEEGRQARNLVFMGMGEPLRNYDRLCEAIDLLVNPRYFAFSPRRITVSSLGLAPEMLRFARRFPQVSLALSLNAHNDQARSLIMPVNQRHDMAVLRRTLEELEEVRKTGILIEYIVFEGINDTPEAAAEVGRYLQGLDVKVNLIPYNDSDGAMPFRSASRDKIDAFQKVLQDQGYQVTKRYSLGQDIAAACGQLANKEKPA